MIASTSALAHIARVRFGALVPACWLALAGTAHATHDVSSAVVEAGARSVEIRSGWQHGGNNRFRLREHLDYAFNDTFALRLISRQQYSGPEDWRYTGTELEARIQLVEKTESGWAFGMRASYEFADPATSDADEAGIQFLNQWDAKPFEYRLNLSIGHETGHRSQPGLEVGTQAQVMYVARPGLKAGVELFSGYESEESESGWNAHLHQFGPVAKIRLSDAADIQIGYLAGLTPSSPDGEAKLFITVSW